MNTPRLPFTTAFDARRAAAVALWVAWACAGAATAADLTVTVTDQHGQPVADAVVIVRGLAGEPDGGAGKSAQIDQVGKQFVPVVSAVRTGASITFPNNDHIRHHVYSFSPAKSFELPLYEGVPASPVAFDRAGVVTLGCNIHDWMVAYVYVSDSPWFVMTDQAGIARLHALPPGDGRVSIWHPGTGEADGRPVALSGQATSTLAWQVTLRDNWNPHRAPAFGADAGRY